VELKCSENLGKEHQAQVFNYLKVSQLPMALLRNSPDTKLKIDV
jgi:GxxExxY protein